MPDDSRAAHIYRNDHAFVLEALNHYVRLDGAKVTVQAMALTDRNSSDVSTVFAKEAPDDLAPIE